MQCAITPFTIVNLESGRETNLLPARSKITQAWRAWFGLVSVKIRADACPLANSFEIMVLRAPKRSLSIGQRAGVWEVTVWAREISVVQTGFSVAQTVRVKCDFRSSQRFSASICSAGTVHVFGHKTHVFDMVCNNLATSSAPAFFHVDGVTPGNT